jgi:hypothetical protein
VVNSPDNLTLKLNSKGQAWWYMSVISATQEAEVKGPMSKNSLGKSKTLSKKTK